MQRWSPLATAAYSTRIPIRRAAESVDGYWDDGLRYSLDVVEIYIEERKGCQDRIYCISWRI